MMQVIAAVPMHEAGRDYRPGESLEVTTERGLRLQELAMAVAPDPTQWDELPDQVIPQPLTEAQLSWARTRAKVGAGPERPCFPCRRDHVREMRPGEKLLVARKVGGLGDILIQSMLFPMLRDQFPDIAITYAVPTMYHELFAETWLPVFSHHELYAPDGGHYGPDSPYHSCGIRTVFLEQYDLIEELSRPCVWWEHMQIHYKTIDGAPGFRWRNRLDRWAGWMGVEIVNPRSIVQITAEEIEAARQQFLDNGKPHLVFSPYSGPPNRRYPWYHEVKHGLEQLGWNVYYLHHEPLGTPQLTVNNLRHMGALCGAADYIVATDTSTFHWGGILHRPTLGLFNLLLGESHAEHYPTAKTVQLCDTPCIGAKHYFDQSRQCEKWYKGKLPSYAEQTSRCFWPASVDQVLAAVGPANGR